MSRIQCTISVLRMKAATQQGMWMTACSWEQPRLAACQEMGPQSYTGKKLNSANSNNELACSFPRVSITLAFNVSHFRRLEVQDGGMGRVGSFWRLWRTVLLQFSLLGLLMAFVSHLCLIFLPLTCLSLWYHFFFLQGHQSYRIITLF